MSLEVFRLALPGSDVHRGQPAEMVLDNLLDSPKIDTAADPKHLGIISLNWKSTAPVPNDTVRLLAPFPHKFNQIPIVFASYKFDNGFNVLKGTLPFQLGALGIITMDADDNNVNLKYYSFDIGATSITPFVMQLRFYVMAEPGK